MPEAKLTSKGQITLPKQVRDALHLQEGDRVEFITEEDGRILIQPVSRDVRELQGLLRREGGKVASIDEMNEAIARRRASRSL